MDESFALARLVLTMNNVKFGPALIEAVKSVTEV
jgi:hypothetical protein